MCLVSLQSRERFYSHLNDAGVALGFEDVVEVVYEFGVDLARESFAGVVGQDADEHYGLVLHGGCAGHCEKFADLRSVLEQASKDVVVSKLAWRHAAAAAAGEASAADTSGGKYSTSSSWIERISLGHTLIHLIFVNSSPHCCLHARRKVSHSRLPRLPDYLEHTRMCAFCCGHVRLHCVVFFCPSFVHVVSL